jgi:hypothetical protein
MFRQRGINNEVVSIKEGRKFTSVPEEYTASPHAWFEP